LHILWSHFAVNIVVKKTSFILRQVSFFSNDNRLPKGDTEKRQISNFIGYSRFIESQGRKKATGNKYKLTDCIAN